MGHSVKCYVFFGVHKSYLHQNLTSLYVVILNWLIFVLWNRILHGQHYFVICQHFIFPDFTKTWLRDRLTDWVTLPDQERLPPLNMQLAMCMHVHGKRQYVYERQLKQPFTNLWIDEIRQLPGHRDSPSVFTTWYKADKPKKEKCPKNCFKIDKNINMKATWKWNNLK